MSITYHVAEHDGA